MKTLRINDSKISYDKIKQIMRDFELDGDFNKWENDSNIYVQRLCQRMKKYLNNSNCYDIDRENCFTIITIKLNKSKCLLTNKHLPGGEWYGSPGHKYF